MRASMIGAGGSGMAYPKPRGVAFPVCKSAWLTSRTGRPSYRREKPSSVLRLQVKRRPRTVTTATVGVVLIALLSLGAQPALATTQITAPASSASLTVGDTITVTAEFRCFGDAGSCAFDHMSATAKVSTNGLGSDLGKIPFATCFDVDINQGLAACRYSGSVTLGNADLGASIISAVHGNGLGTASLTLDNQIAGANTAPVNTLASNASFLKNVSGPISFTVADDDDDELTITISATNGSVAATGGTGVVVNGAGTKSMQIIGKPGDINAATSGSFGYIPDTDYVGNDLVEVFTTDGNGGSDGDFTSIEVTEDTTKPVLMAITQPTTPTNSTPKFVFKTDEDGDISVGGSCGSPSNGNFISANTNTTIDLTRPDNSTALADGTYSDCTVTVTDSSSNTSDPLAISSFTVDFSAPSVTSITRFDPADEVTDADELTFLVTFSEGVDGATVENADFAVSGPSGVTITVAQSLQSVAIYAVKVSGGDMATFEGTVELNLSQLASVTDLNGNIARRFKQPTTFETYTLQRGSGVDEDAIRRRTEAIANNFIGNRGNQITSNEYDFSRRANRGNGGNSGGAVNFTGEGNLSEQTMSFGTSLRQVLNASAAKKNQRLGDLAQGLGVGDQSIYGGNGPATGIDIWMRGQWARFDNDDTSGDFGLVFIGADYRFENGLVLGFVTSIDWTSEENNTQNFKADGRGWLAGPYVVANITDKLIFDGRVAWGRADNSISPFNTYEDDFDSERWLISGKLTGSFSAGGNVLVQPHVGIIYFEEEQEAYTDSNGIGISAQTVELGRLTFGPKVSTSYTTGDGTLVAPYVGIKGIWDFETADTLDLTTGLAASGNEDFRGRVDGGFAVGFTDGVRLTGEGFYDGIGADEYSSYGASVNLRLPLQYESDTPAALRPLSVNGDKSAEGTPAPKAKKPAGQVQAPDLSNYGDKMQ